MKMFTIKNKNETYNKLHIIKKININKVYSFCGIKKNKEKTLELIGFEFSPNWIQDCIQNEFCAKCCQNLLVNNNKTKDLNITNTIKK